MGTLFKKINNFDLVTFRWCLSRKYTPRIASVSRWISHCGDGVYYIVIGALLALYEQNFGFAFLLTGLLSFAIELPLYLMLKNTIKRRRPNDVIAEFVAFLIPSDKFSFPSGHTAAGFVMATITAWYYPSFSILAYTLAAMIGFSRVLLGVHFPSDILAGATLGASSAMLAIHIYN